MIFRPTPLAGAFVIEPQLITDERGFFARTWCKRELGERDLSTRLAQCNISWNREAGTLRGMHYQAEPAAEVKLVRCTQGSIFDVIVDLRKGSETFLGWFGATLTRDNRLMMYVPGGFAHGFLTLTPDAEVFYQMSEFYNPALARGVRWDDPAFGIAWPSAVAVINERDRSYPDFYARKDD